MNMVFGDMTQTEAAKRAGYSPNSAHVAASRLLKDDKIIAEIEELKADRAKAEMVSANYIVAKLLKNANRAMQEEGVFDKEGKFLGEFSYNGTVANKALELVGKAKNIFEAHQKAGAVQVPDFSKFQMDDTQDRLSKKDEE